MHTMIIRSLARRPGAVQSLAQRACRAPSYARHKHTVPNLLNHAQLEENGIPGLFSKKGFEIAYTQYQGHIINELNTATNGLPEQNMDAKSLIVKFARDPDKAYMFNLASMAYNNHFFFRGINANPDVRSAPSEDIKPLINRNFSSLDSLRDTMILTAEAMFGPGFVWLVQTDGITSDNSLKIMTTYLAGSPLSGAHHRRQAVDLNTENVDTMQAGAFGDASGQNVKPKKPQKPLGGVDVTPLLCVNTWEHVWLHDYGIGGKMRYLEKWWNAIDWVQAEQYLTRPGSFSKSLGQGVRNFHFN